MRLFYGELIEKLAETGAELKEEQEAKKILADVQIKAARLWPVLDLDRALKDVCAWLQDYLQNHVSLSEEDRRLCDGI